MPQAPAVTPIAFERFVLDLARGCLLQDAVEITLRPEAFAVLAYLAQRPGQLITQQELLDAVWTNLIVTDDTLVQSIGELRRALGDDDAKLIVTVPRRGYRFDAKPPHAPKGPLTWRWKYGIAAPLAVALIVGLTWLAFRWHAPPFEAAPRTETPAIAVLPFQNQGEPVGDDQLADSLTQDIIRSLGHFSGLSVMSWNAVAPYKAAAARPGEVARVLAVRYQVEGSVRYAGGRMLVSAQLVDAQGRVLWSGRFDEARVDTFLIQERIAREIAGILAIRVTQPD